MTWFDKKKLQLAVIIKSYVIDFKSIADEFQSRFEDLVTIEKEIMFFFIHLSLDLEMLLRICSWNSLNCSVMRNFAPDNNSYSRLDKDWPKDIRTFAKNMLSLFASTYLCEQTFTVKKFNKNRVGDRVMRISDSHQC